MMATAAALLILAAAGTTPPEALECPVLPGKTLVYIDVYDGPPENEADLVPDQHEDKASKTAWNTWELYRTLSASMSNARTVSTL
jgi:hypothetical protein